jgi:hypothetical protein
MADWTKKTAKALRGDLQPGESVDAAVFVQPCGTMGSAVGKGVGGLIGKAVAGRFASDPDETLDSDRGIAAEVGEAPLVLALTSQRLLVMSYSSLSGKPKEVRASFDRADLAGVRTEKQKASHHLVAHFADGTAREYEAPKLANDPEGFAAAIDR